MTKRPLVVLAIGLLAAWPTRAYWNLDPNAGISGGAHRAINRSAWDLFVTTRVREVSHEDPILKQYKFKEADLRALTGPTYTNRGNWPDDMNMANGSFNVPTWIAEGGFTADEPEVFACLRHFYDPTAPEGQRYLTDVPWQGRFREYVRSKWRRDVETVNPRIDARMTALSVPGSSYTWREGAQSLRRALSDLPYKKEERERDTAMCWRALGEVMHLMADMTMPSHTRNDGHPGALPAGNLRPDPYEEWILGSEVEAAYRTIPRTGPLSRLDPDAAMPAEIAGAIGGASTPEALFQAVALYTNQHFVTNDTMSGTGPDGKSVVPVNGHVYPRPKLGGDLVWDPQFRVYTSAFENRGTVLMAKQTWQSNTWGSLLGKLGLGLTGGSYGYESSQDCALSMANVLVPIAVAANAKLLDWYLPRFAITITAIGAKAAGQPVKGSVEHTPRGPHTQRIMATLSPDQPIDLYLDGKRQDPRDYELKLEKGVLSGKLKDLDVSKAKRIWVEMELAGLRVASADYAANGYVFVRVCKPENEVVNRMNPLIMLAGEPIPDLEVTCEFEQQGKTRTLKATTDDQGEARFTVPLGVEATITATGKPKTVTCTADHPRQAATFGWQGHDPLAEAPVGGRP